MLLAFSQQSAFVTGSSTHVLTVACAAFILILLCVFGSHVQARSDEAERRLRRCWIAFVIFTQIAIQIWSLTGDRLDVARSLPIHFCDLSPWLCVLALLTQNAMVRAIAFFWAFGLATWAFIMPTLATGPDSLAFWAHWIGHWQIMASAAYLVAVDRYRPNMRGLLSAFAVTVVYSLMLVPVNIWLDADYGSVGNVDASPVAPFGPWPWRIGVLLVAELVMFVLVALPWWLTALRLRGRET